MKTEQSPKPEKPGRHHPLVLQEHLNEQVFWPSILIVCVTAGLLIVNRQELAPHRVALVLLLAGAGLALILTYVYRFRAYVQCGSDGLRIQLPFYRLTIPYSRIRATRPNDFYRLYPPDQQRWTQRAFLDGLWGMTVVLVDLEQLPRSRKWLRLWMSKYMLDPNGPSFTLAVRDWIALRSDLDEHLSRSRGTLQKP
jgi:hypothetical protein